MNLLRPTLFLAALLGFGALTSTAHSVHADTGKMLSRVQVTQAVPGTQMGDATYAEVNSAWLHQFYSDYRSELSRLGIVKWDSRFNCRHFASYYTELAQSRFFTANFQSSMPAKSLAIAQVWYHQDKDNGGHAIVMAMTEKGKIFIEPQTGEELHLSQTEQASIFFSVM